MIRPVCLRALTLALPITGIAAMDGAAQTNQPPPQNPPRPVVIVAPANDTRQTPAQEKYGLPQNPVVGSAENIDLRQPLRLDRAIRVGLQRRNSIAISKTQTDSASARLTQSRSSYYPQITPNYSYNYNMRPGGTFNLNGQQFSGSAISENVNSNVIASLQLFDSGQREARVGQSRRSLFATEYGLGDERQTVILGVTEGYYNLLRARAINRVQEQTVTRAKTSLESLRAQVAVGNAAQSDTLQSEADLAQAEVDLLQAQVDYDVAQATLKTAMGIVSYDPVILPEEPVPPPPTTPDTNSLEEYIDLAYKNRLDLKQQQERINAQGYVVRLAQLNAGVSVNANLQVGYQVDPNSGETRVFGFSASYPIFDGFNSRAAIKDSKAGLESERRSLDQLEQTVRFAVEQAFLVREQSRMRYTATDKAVRAAQLNYDAALERQRNGLINVLDVLTAQLQLVNAQVAYVQAIFDYYIADARLKRNIGVNDPDYMPRVPGFKPARVTLQSGKPSFFSQLAQNAPPPPVPGAASAPSANPSAAERKP